MRPINTCHGMVPMHVTLYTPWYQCTYITLQNGIYQWHGATMVSPLAAALHHGTTVNTMAWYHS